MRKKEKICNYHFCTKNKNNNNEKKRNLFSCKDFS